VLPPDAELRAADAAIAASKTEAEEKFDVTSLPDEAALSSLPGESTNDLEMEMLPETKCTSCFFVFCKLSTSISNVLARVYFS